MYNTMNKDKKSIENLFLLHHIYKQMHTKCHLKT